MRIAKILMAAACSAILMGQTAQAQTSAEELGNDQTYTLRRATTPSAAVYADPEGTQVLVKTGTNSTDDAKWVFYHDKSLGMTFLYNAGAKKFAAARQNAAVLVDNPVSVKLEFYTKGTVNGLTVLLGDEPNLLGLGAELAGTNILLTSDSCKVTDGHFMRLTKSRVLTDEEQAELASKVDADAIRAGYVDTYRAFVDQVKEMDKDGYAHYAGGYDVTDLEAALNNATEYSLADLQNLYNAALASRNPKAGHYYRIKNSKRTTANSHNNVLTMNAGLTRLKVESQSTVRIGSTATRAESLGLFLFDETAGGYTVRAAAAPRAFGDSQSASAVGLEPVASGHPYALETVGQWSRLFRFANSTRNTWLTANGEGELHNYGIMEGPMEWWLEEITTITRININSRSMGAVTFPCPVLLPEGYKACIVTKASNEGIEYNSIGDMVPANTPVLIVGEQGYIDVAVLPEYTEIPAYSGKNLLAGCTIGLKSQPGRYTIASNGTEQTMAKKAAGDITANSAWLPAEELGLTASSIPMTEGEGSVDAITVGPERPAVLPGDMIYDYNGRRVNNPTPGLYINATTGRPVMIR